jgi:hypothetical protein
MVEAAPALMRLRLVQALEDGNGNVVVMGLPQGAFPVPVNRPGQETGRRITTDDR